MAFLIPRLHDPLTGSVSIDGVDIRNISFQNLGRLVGVVTQETYLLHDTIKENLRYGNPTATDLQIEDASRAAAIHEHIAGLPDGYNTIVGERGYKLSGGEKQRLAIARALVKRPEIYVFDDSFSALDTATDARLRAALRREVTDATLIVVAQRVATVQDADQIIVLDRGLVVGRGTHAELLASNETYAEIVNSQLRAEVGA